MQYIFLTRNHEKVLSNGRTPLAKLVLQGYMHLLFKHAPPVNLHSREAAWPERWFSEHLHPATREEALRLPSHCHCKGTLLHGTDAQSCVFEH